LSHVVTIKTELRDPAAIHAAARRLGLAAPVQGTAQLYAAEASGMIVQLPGWHYPIVCDIRSGQVAYDNFSGHWGEQAELDKFLQTYACEKTKIEARRQGHSVTEQPLSDGSIKLTIQVAGGVS
jgi:hypothetical protein